MKRKATLCLYRVINKRVNRFTSEIMETCREEWHMKVQENFCPLLGAQNSLCPQGTTEPVMLNMQGLSSKELLPVFSPGRQGVNMGNDKVTFLLFERQTSCQMFIPDSSLPRSLAPSY